MSYIAIIPLSGPHPGMAIGIAIRTRHDRDALANIAGIALAAANSVHWDNSAHWIHEDNEFNMSIEELRAYGEFMDHTNQQAWKPFKGYMDSVHYRAFSDLWRNLRDRGDRRFRKLGVITGPTGSSAPELFCGDLEGDIIAVGAPEGKQHGSHTSLAHSDILASSNGETEPAVEPFAMFDGQISRLDLLRDDEDSSAHFDKEDLTFAEEPMKKVCLRLYAESTPREDGPATPQEHRELDESDEHSEKYCVPVNDGRTVGTC